VAIIDLYSCHLSVCFKCSMSSTFYARRSKKCKKILITWQNFYTFVICTCKSFEKTCCRNQSQVSTNILRAAFCAKEFYGDFMCLLFVFVVFWWKEIGTKAARKLLVKLTRVVKQNFLTHWIKCTLNCKGKEK